jgi:creatinine amidohydrolase
MDIVARDLRARNDMLVVTCGWHRFGYPDGLFSAEEQQHGIHGGEIETSLMLATRPDAVHMDKAENFAPATVAMEKEFRWLNASRPAGFGWMTQDLHPSGAVGNAKAATAQKGEAALEHGARAFVELLNEVDRFDLAKLKPGPLG